MAFIASKFNMPTYGGSGLANQQAYADALLTKVKDAFIDANSAWSLESAIETIGTNTDIRYGLRTLQLKSGASGKYLRIWCFCGSSPTSGQFVDADTASGGFNAIKLNKANFFKCNDGSNANRCIFGDSSSCELTFGVASQSIGADLGYDLSLDAPLFSINNNYTSMGSSKTMSYTASYGLYNKGGTITVMTDGKMLSVMQLFEGTSALNTCIYAPDLMVNINPDDTNTAGVLSTITDSGTGSNLYFGNNDPFNAESYIRVMYNAADGTRNFDGMRCSIYNGKGVLMASENYTKILTCALQCQMFPNTYSGSTMTGVIDRVGMKGWINTDYVRSANITHLPKSNKGLKFGNGNWLCVDEGTLICWDDSNTSPFEAAT